MPRPQIAAAAAIVLSLLALLATTATASEDGGACTGTRNEHPVWTAPPVFVRGVKNGQRLVAGPPSLAPQIIVVNVSGSAFEMGEAQGQLLKAELLAFLPQVLQYIGKALAAPGNGLPPPLQAAFTQGGAAACLDMVYNLTKPFIHRRFTEELAGLASGSGLPEVTFRRVAMLGELTKMGCSMIGAWSASSL